MSPLPIRGISREWAKTLISVFSASLWWIKSLALNVALKAGAEEIL